jgi:hypothetical protein
MELSPVLVLDQQQPAKSNTRITFENDVDTNEANDGKAPKQVAKRLRKSSEPSDQFLQSDKRIKTD